MLESPFTTIVIPTIVRTSLYPLMEALLEQEVTFPYEIVLVAQSPVDEEATTDTHIRVHYEEPGQGISHYRNMGSRLARGEVLAFIDDDEMPQDRYWLANLVAPIEQGQESVVTAGVLIPLGQGFLADSFSLLGFPGGGAIGFEHLWRVTNSRTNHLCSGNFAIREEVLSEVGGFAEEAKLGGEDVALAKELGRRGVPILYEPKATLIHSPRSDFREFVRWNLLRGVAAGRYLKATQHNQKVSERLHSSLRILRIVWSKHRRLFPGVVFAMANQYLWQTIGALWGVKGQK